MDIHTMIANAAADIRAMELRIVHLQDEVKRTTEDNERLRQENAAITAARMHAEADLVHYQNVFVASVCVEAGSICKEFFNLTQEKVRERAEGAIQKYIEERIAKERKENLTSFNNPEGKADHEEFEYVTREYLTTEDEVFKEFDKSIEETAPKSAEIQVTHLDSETYVKPTFTLKERILKNKTDKLKASASQEPIPKFLTESKKEEPPTTLRALIATIGF